MKCTLLEKGTILITSRPHACETLDVDRIIEVVGFGKEEIRGFVEKSFSKDMKCAEECLQRLKEYPHLESLSYVPMNLVMIVNIFECGGMMPPSTLTELLQMFVVMILQRQVRKKFEGKQVCLTVATSEDCI